MATSLKSEAVGCGLGMGYGISSLGRTAGSSQRFLVGSLAVFAPDGEHFQGLSSETYSR